MPSFNSLPPGHELNDQRCGSFGGMARSNGVVKRIRRMRIKAMRRRPSSCLPHAPPPRDLSSGRDQAPSSFARVGTGGDCIGLSGRRNLFEALHRAVSRHNAHPSGRDPRIIRSQRSGVLPANGIEQGHQTGRFPLGSGLVLVRGNRTARMDVHRFTGKSARNAFPSHTRLARDRAGLSHLFCSAAGISVPNAFLPPVSRFVAKSKLARDSRLPSRTSQPRCRAFAARNGKMAGSHADCTKGMTAFDGRRRQRCGPRSLSSLMSQSMPRKKRPRCGTGARYWVNQGTSVPPM